MCWDVLFGDFHSDTGDTSQFRLKSSRWPGTFPEVGADFTSGGYSYKHLLPATSVTLSIFHLSIYFVRRKSMIVKRQSCKKNQKGLLKRTGRTQIETNYWRKPHDQEPARLENSTNLSPHSNPAHLQLFFKAAGCLDASIVQGKTSSTPEILWFMIVLNMKNITHDWTDPFFQSRTQKGNACKMRRKNRAHVNMPKGCTSPVFAASGFSLNIPDQPIKSLDH